MTINVDVIGQKLKIVSNTKNLVSGSQNFVRFFFNLDSSWDGLTVFAQFQQNGTSYNQTLDSENSAYLPAEIVDGKVDLSLYGTGGTVIATVNYLTFTVDKSIIVENAQSTQISTPIYTQIINRITALIASPAGFGGDVGTELRDVRVGWDGTLYETAGDALRGQINAVYDLALTGSGEFINDNRFGAAPFENDFDNVPNNKIYPVNLTSGVSRDNSPGATVSGVMITYGRSTDRANGDTQMIISVGQAIWTRTYWASVWTPWIRQVRISELEALTKPWNGLKLSVLGDSVSTYPGYIPNGHACYYATSGYKGISSVNSMWWKQLCDLTGAEPLVIEAWSGCCCAEYDSMNRTGNEDIPAAVNDSRCKNLHMSNGNNIVNPDIICVAVGCNDFYYNVPLGTWDGHTSLSPTDTKTWRGAYANMLLKIQETYPNAIVFCFSPWFCVRGNVNNGNAPSEIINVNGNNAPYQDYEDAMKEICELLGAIYIDVNNVGFTRQNFASHAVGYNDETGAVTHPNATGQEILGQSIASAVRDKAIGYVNWLKAQRGV